MSIFVYLYVLIPSIFVGNDFTSSPPEYLPDCQSPYSFLFQWTGVAVFTNIAIDSPGYFGRSRLNSFPMKILGLCVVLYLSICMLCAERCLIIRFLNVRTTKCSHASLQTNTHTLQLHIFANTYLSWWFYWQKKEEIYIYMHCSKTIYKGPSPNPIWMLAANVSSPIFYIVFIHCT